MRERVRLNQTHEWTNVVLPCSPSLQTEYAYVRPDLVEAFPLFRFVGPADLRVNLVRFTRLHAGQVSFIQPLLKREVLRLCSSPIVLEKPEIYKGNPYVFSLDLGVTGSIRFIGIGGQIRRQLISALGRRFQAAGENTRIRCTFATVPRELVAEEDLADTPDQVEQLLGTLPWTFTPDRVLSTSKSIVPNDEPVSHEIRPSPYLVAA